MRRLPVRIWAMCVLSALLQSVPFPLAGPVPLPRRVFCWICLVPLLMALLSSDAEGRPLSTRSSALAGYLCGVLWFFCNCYWIYQTMYHYGGLPPLAAAGILVLFSLYLGLYFALFGSLVGAVRRLWGRSVALLTAPFLCVAVELARTWITGFPWDLLGYTQVDNSYLSPLAAITGVMGLSLVVAAGNVLWLLWRPARPATAAGPLLAIVLVAVQIAGTLREEPLLPAQATAVLLQDNLSVGTEAAGPRESQPEMVRSFAALTAQPEKADGTGRYLAGSLPQPDLLAWPEAPTSFADGDPNLRAALGAIARAHHAPLVVDAVGAPPPAATGRPDAGAGSEYVSASFYLPDGSYAGRYDKMHLVPFGEYTPYKQVFFFAGHLLDGLNFVPGTQRRLFSVNGHRFGVFICYESIFGDEIRQFARDGAQVLVNLSDDGWYGDTSAPWEHLDMARMRAIENRRWLLRDTNTGLTASIDPKGRIVAALPRHIRDAIAVPFGYGDEVTLYTRYGDWLGEGCAAGAVLLLAGGVLKRKRAHGAGAPRRVH